MLTTRNLGIFRIFATNNVLEYLFESCYLLLENETHSTHHHGHGTKHISKSKVLMTDIENDALWISALVSELKLMYLSQLLHHSCMEIFCCGNLFSILFIYCPIIPLFQVRAQFSKRNPSCKPKMLSQI